MRWMLVVVLVTSGLVVSTASPAAGAEMSPGCQAVNEIGTLTPPSSSIPDYVIVTESWFTAGEVATIAFTGDSGSGWLSIADADGEFGHPFQTTKTTPSALSHTFDGSETGAFVFAVESRAEVTCGVAVSDDDGDGVLDDDDMCADTDLATDIAPSGQRRHRLWSDATGHFVFGDGTDSGTMLADTAGCSARQVIEAASLGNGHSKHGISKGALAAHVARHDSP
ncbi:MAG TPA: hypothetical protein VMW08_12860 [Acidimicrobiales bacterium]|nr:hypothetical protein [Acidimicrobiales bacterium]